MNNPAQNTSLIHKQTQTDRILELLRERGNAGIPVWEMIAPRPQGLGVAQYNARVYELRQKGYEIVNKDNTFYLIEQGQIGLGLAF